MARNDERRRQLADAAIEVLAQEGARGLTHRAVDRAADVPQGTTSNYFRHRSALIEGLVDRIGERLRPTEADLAWRSTQTPNRELFADYMRDIVRRLTDNRNVTVALFELRLESSRRPDLAALISAWRQAGFEGDISFNKAAQLPGDHKEILLFHYAMDGMLFDRLTNPLHTAVSTDEAIDALVTGLLPQT